MIQQGVAPATDHAPFEFKLARRARLSPASIAVAVASGALVLILGAYYISGISLVPGSPDAGWSLAPQTHAGLLAAVLLGYGVGATLYIDQFITAWRPVDVARSRWGGAAGLTVGLVVSALTIQDIRTLEPDRSLLNAGEALLNIAFLLLFWALGRAGYFAAISVLRPRTAATVDVFDLKPLYTHGRDQVRMAMVWFIGAALFVAIMLLDPNPAVQLDSVKVLGPILAGYVVLATAMILLPLRRIWRAIRAAKESALATVTPELTALRLRADAPPGREADLLARRAFIANLPEWPIDAASIGAFAFYVLLPFLTWTGGAVVKKLFDTVFMEKIITAIMGLMQG